MALSMPKKGLLRSNVASIRSVLVPYVPYVPYVLYKVMFRTMLNANIECQQSACLVGMIWVEDRHGQARHWLSVGIESGLGMLSVGIKYGHSTLYGT